MTDSPVGAPSESLADHPPAAHRDRKHGHVFEETRGFISLQALAATTGRRGLSWPLLVGAATFLLLFTCSALLNDGDTYMHIATGLWIFDHGAIPVSDPFSHTLRGAPWTAHEWLAQLLFAAAFAGAGWSGVVSLTAAAYAIALALLTRYLLRHLEPIRALLFVAMAASLAAPHMLARPHALVAPMLVLWGVSLLRARETERAPSLWLSLTVVLWANLHGSFPLALVLAAVFAAEGALAASGVARRHAARTWGIFLVAAFAASLLTPQGLDGWRFVADLHRLSFSLSRIGEWRSPDFQQLQPLEICLLIGAVLVLVRGLRLPSLRIALLLGLLHLALQHVRHGELLGLLAPIIVAQPFAAQWAAAEGGTGQASGLDRHFAALARPAGRGATALVLAALAAAAFAVLCADTLRPSSAATPAAALRAVRAAAPAGPVFNAYEFGGYLIFSGVAPYIDGRADLYGDDFVMGFSRAATLSTPDLLPSLLERHHIGWTLLQPDLPAVALLDQLPGWRRLYADGTAVVHVRQ